jgi:hypothetical protein
MLLVQYPAYLRGLALLNMGNGRTAETEFEMMIGHPGIVGRQAIGAIVWLQLGRARKVSPDAPSARRHYEHFVALWQHADPDVPVLTQAKMSTRNCNEI